MAEFRGFPKSPQVNNSRDLVREWNREIEAEIRHEARQDGGPWKIVIGVAPEVLWFVALLAMLGVFNRAHW